MDPNRLDDLARLIGSGQSRRRVLKTFAAGALGAIATSLGLGVTLAERVKRSPGELCASNSECGSNLCVDDGYGRKTCHCQVIADCSKSTALCHPRVCIDGICGHDVSKDGTPCESGDACTSGDVCFHGGCKPGKRKVCPPRTDRHCQFADTCNDDTGECEIRNQPNGTDCPSPDYCHPDATCQAGACNPGPLRDCKIAHATSLCANGACGITACDAGWGNCNGSIHDGCDTPLLTDIHNCGACGVACSTSSDNVCLGVATCTNGVCGSVPRPRGYSCGGDKFCDGLGSCKTPRIVLQTKTSGSCTINATLTGFRPNSVATLVFTVLRRRDCPERANNQKDWLRVGGN